MVLAIRGEFFNLALHPGTSNLTQLNTLVDFDASTGRIGQKRHRSVLSSGPLARDYHCGEFLAEFVQIPHVKSDVNSTLHHPGTRLQILAERTHTASQRAVIDRPLQNRKTEQRSHQRAS